MKIRPQIKVSRANQNRYILPDFNSHQWNVRFGPAPLSLRITRAAVFMRTLVARNSTETEGDSAA